MQQLLKELSAVRASDDGVLDGNSLDGSLRELDTDPEEEGGDSATSTTRKDGKKRKSKRKSMVGRLREAAEEQESEEDGGREKESRSPRKKSSKRKEVAEEEEYPAEYDEVVPLAGEPGTSSNPSPKKRKAAVSLRRISSLVLFPAILVSDSRSTTPLYSALWRRRNASVCFGTQGEIPSSCILSPKAFSQSTR